MASIEYRIGDLFSASDVDALAHGCNCAGAMGRGIAVEFKRRWPMMYREYRVRCQSGEFGIGDVFPWRASEGVVIYNLGTQAHWRVGATLPGVVTAVKAMLDHAAEHGVRRIAMPRIAAGLGGLDWRAVEAAITPVIESAQSDVIVYELSQGT
ncbi:macro domain-containing protein [Streptomyces rectiverticillatus]|uniref:macro domain-containing protein n=1 Tax=Streptomyces rectiverticillatus TaxID=173860 RepID=UPI0015C33A92|nr:macro domain-containing protein [Streptomyces rectiverticillatus]QLE72257.1 macro domain-containing protein [Streptomyces rectiverticillatus]